MHDAGISRVGFLSPLSLACRGHLLPVSSLGLPSGHGCVLIFLLIRTPVILGHRASPNDFLLIELYL